MKKTYRGSVTVFMAWTILSFLLLCLVFVEGTRIYYLRVKTAQAMDLSEFSVLSEYQKELLEHYGLFFLDLDYEKGKERQDLLNGRIANYLEKNISEVTTEEVKSQKFHRATDGTGAPFVEQAVKCVKKGYGLDLIAERLNDVDLSAEENLDLEELLEEKEGAANGILHSLVDDRGNLLFDIALPEVSFPTIHSLTAAVFGETDSLSRKSVPKVERILYRPLEKGVGNGRSISFTDMQFFYHYLFQHLNHYGKEDENVWKDSLEYQMEYIIAGKSDDRENLENIMWRIFLLRASGNYLLIHQDFGEVAKAEAKAVALAGVTANPPLISLVKELFLISKAIDEGITDTRKIFAGEKVPLYQQGVVSAVQMGYEEYLWMFLNTVGRRNCVFRAMDVIELEIRKKAEYENFRWDHCVDSFEVEWSYCYEGILRNLPLAGEGIYERKITRKMGYEI